MSAYTYGASRNAELRREHDQLVEQLEETRLELDHLQRQTKKARRKVRKLQPAPVVPLPATDTMAAGDRLIAQLKTVYPEDAAMGPIRIRAANAEANLHAAKSNYRKTRDAA